jgi:hypothetical protein
MTRALRKGFDDPWRLVATTAAATTTAVAATATTTAAAFATVAATATAAATTVTAATTTAVAAASRTFFLRTGFIDGELAAHEIFFVQAMDRFAHRGRGVHGDEGETTWAARDVIDWQEEIGHRAEIREELTEVCFRGREGQVAHIHFGIHIVVLNAGNHGENCYKLRLRISEHQRIRGIT